MVAGDVGSACCKLPFPLTVCSCCGAGIKQTRGFTWINSKLFSDKTCTENSNCIFSMPNEKMGLLWIGTKYYPTAEDFIKEANIQGLSRRIAQIPRELEVGKTWIALAHPKAIDTGRDDEKGNRIFIPAIVRAFIPKAIEYIVTGQETEDELDAMEKRGFTLIKVVRDIDVVNEIETPQA